MAAISAAAAKTAAPTLAGALAGLTLAGDDAAPVWFRLLVMTASLAFALISASGQSGKHAQRLEARRLALANAGALWMLTAAIVSGAELSTEGAMITALAVGFGGAKPLKALTRRFMGGDE